MQLLILAGPNVHRGYSWPGLEKVSQYVHKDGEDSDAEDQELRKVEDCKVSWLSPERRPLH